MSTERKMLAWAGLLVSVLVCCPCALLTGLFTVAVGYPGESTMTQTEATYFIAIFGVITVLVLAVGVFFFVWSVRTLLRASRQGEVNLHDL